jgi:hypothetical protein
MMFAPITVKSSIQTLNPIILMTKLASNPAVSIKTLSPLIPLTALALAILFAGLALAILFAGDYVLKNTETLRV